MFGLRGQKTQDTPEVVEARRQALRSSVRVYITYGAGVYLIVASAGLIAAAFLGEDAQAFDNSKDIFMATLPVATGILTYWFADRSATKRLENEAAGGLATGGASQAGVSQAVPAQEPRQTEE